MLNIPVVERIVSRLGHDAEVASLASVSRRSLQLLADEALGEDMRRYEDGRMLIWDIARHDGYTIPPYPMAGCGDVRTFLQDEGVRNVPEWYEVHLNIDRTTYDHMYAYHLVMVRNQALYRRVWVVPSMQMQGSVEQLGRWVLEWARFALSDDTSARDARLFKR